MMKMMTAVINQLRALPSWLLLLCLLGLFSLLSTLLLPFLKWLHAAFLRPRKDLARYGPWAVVTGATDGIGRALAFRLAADCGLHLLLVGRNPAKLRQVSADVAAACGGRAEVRSVVIDLAGDAAEGRRRLEMAVEGLDVGLLVNNAGTTHPDAAYLHEMEEDAWETIVKVNVEAATWVARTVLRGMVKRGRGAVVNIGSASATALPSFPFHAIYAATKAYVDQLSKSLNVEYKDKGIDVQCQIPFYVATKLISTRETSLFVPSPDQYAEAAVRWIGYESICTPYWPHAVQWFLVSWLPDFILNAWRLHVGIRKRSEMVELLSTQDLAKLS